MKLLRIACSSVVCATLGVGAQSYEWSIPASPFSIEPTIRGSQLGQGQGGAYVLTNANIGSLGDADMLLLKLDASGAITHVLTIGDTGGQGYRDVGMEAVQLGGNLFICGYTRAIDTASPPTFTSFVIRTDTALNFQWQKNYILPGPMELYANSMTPTDNGQLLIAGQIYDGSEFQSMLMKVAADGSVMWMKQYDIEFGERVQCVRELPGGDILFSGSVVFGFELVLPFAFKVNMNGDFIWGKYYNYPPASFVEGSSFLFIQAQSVGDIMLCGHTDVMGAGGEDFYIVDVDSSGAVNWARTYGASQFEFPYAVHWDAAANELVMLGNTGSYSASFTPLPLAMRMAPNGLLLGAALYGDTATTQLALLDHCQRIDATHRIVSGWRGSPADDQYLAGTDNDLMNVCNVYPISPGVSLQTSTTGDFTAVVTTPAYLQNDLALGTSTFSGGTILCDSPLNIDPIQGSTSGLSVLPNPTSGAFQVAYEQSMNAHDNITLTDAQGRVVRVVPGNGSRELLIELGDLRSGLYLIRVLRDGAQLGTARLILE